MVEVYSTSHLIEELHFDSGDFGEWIPGARYAFFIHSSVFTECNKMLETNLDHDVVWNYPLQVGNKSFDLKLIFLTIDREEKYDFIQNLVWSSQYSFPWKDQATLYESLSSYHIMEEFINQHNLKSAIEKTEEIKSISVEEENIKVITFGNDIDSNDLNIKYRLFNNSSYGRMKSFYFYFTGAFPWFQEPLLKHFDMPIESNKINSVLPIILCHLYYSNSINLFDLIGIKLAICDFRISQQMNRLENEIDSLIQLTLRKMTLSGTYIKNDIFDLVQYSIDQNCIPTQSCILYLVYTYQNYFNDVRILLRDEITSKPNILSFQTVQVKIKLAEQLDEISKIRERSNMKFKIDGTGFDKMSFPLFFDLLEFDNIHEIILDTNYRWMNTEQLKLNKSYQINAKKKVDLNLFGSNPHNFVEELVGFLKTFIHSNKLNLIVNCSLDSYMIFDNLEITRLEFYKMHIDQKLLDQLTRCNLNVKSIYFELCTLENKVGCWELMMGLKKLRGIKIEEDDSSWESMFEYISKCLINLKMDEFKFSKEVAIYGKSGTIDFEEIRFVLDEYKSKMLIKDFNTQEIKDLYDLKFRTDSDEILVEDFDFYQ